MKEVIGVKFRGNDKVYYYTPNGQALRLGQRVIAKTSHGTECGRVVLENTKKKEEDILTPLRAILRIANDTDIKQDEQNHQKEAQTLRICRDCAEKLNLDMKLIHAKYTFDKSKLIFFFTAENRIDFRKLVKELASIFHTRIEMRQIGVRDEAKVLGGLGICGRALCCSSYLDGFHPVSIKMAKEQNLSLNPAKISGTCGRLMCCLEYEQSAYRELQKGAPENGMEVQTPDGIGYILDGNLLSGIYRVQMKSAPEAAPRNFHRQDLKIKESKKSSPFTPVSKKEKKDKN